MFKAVTTLVTIFILFCLLPSRVLASEFSTNYRATYELLHSGETVVTHQISLKNNLSHIFPREYTLSVGNNDLVDVIAKDKKGNLLPNNTQTTGDQTNITIKLLDPEIGQNQINEFTLRYLATNLATHTGDVWEINIPKIRHGSQMQTVERTIIFPSILGSPTASYPSPDHIETKNDKTFVVFSSSRQEAISLLFGESQQYQLKLEYNLEPPLSKNAMTELALPPDTAYQRVILDSITPEPDNITVDQDGNWLARYFYKENFVSKVQAVLYIEVSPIPIYYDPSINHPNLLHSSKYWPLEESIIKQTAEQLKTPKNIYNFLVENFSYNTGRVAPGADRLGGAQALAKPALAICTEFTDAFVSLARSLGIPAREINGYAITTNTQLRPLSMATDILHSWPEYYDQDTQTWIQVDPTWGHTTAGINYFNKLDYNHITFVRHGKEPTYPYPAGVYKKSRDEKTLDISHTSIKKEYKSSYHIELAKNNHYRIQNTGNSALINHSITLPNGSIHTLAYLPPYGITEVNQVLGEQTSSFSWQVFSLAIITSTLISFLVYRYLTKKRNTK